MLIDLERMPSSRLLNSLASAFTLTLPEFDIPRLLSVVEEPIDEPLTLDSGTYAAGRLGIGPFDGDDITCMLAFRVKLPGGIGAGRVAPPLIDGDDDGVIDLMKLYFKYLY